MGLVDKKWQIYLCGKMTGLEHEEMNSWRADAARKLKEMGESSGYTIIPFNPVDYYNFERVNYQSQEEIMDYDLFHVEHSDFIIVNADGLDTSTGTQLEVFDAWCFGKPVFVFGDYIHPHPWIERCVTRFEPDVNHVIDYIREFYCL